MINRRSRSLSCLLIAALALSACGLTTGKKKTKLAGERYSVLDLQRHIEPDNPALNAEGFVAPEPWKNDYWPQPGGYPGHAMQNVVLNPGALHKAWEADIGEEADDQLPYTSEPVVVDGRVYTVDTRNDLTAFSIKDGNKIWRVNISPNKHHDAVIGGGLAFGAGHLYATNGYNEVLCLNPEDGKPVWRVKIPSAARAAPTVTEDKIYVVTLDNRVFAMSPADGRILWDYQGVSEAAGLVGAASPASDADIVIPAFTSGEIFALHTQNGEVAWQESLADVSTPGIQALADIRGLPVLDKGQVFAVSFGGKLVALDERTGNRIWNRDIGSAVTPWLAGNHLFVLTTDNELVSIGRDTGTISWVRPLPRFMPKDKKHRHPMFWTSPILAGGRLILAGSDGDMVEIDPNTGVISRITHLKRSVSLDPIVAGGTLYLLGDDGTLMAFQ